jgi:hypothetical protein
MSIIEKLTKEADAFAVRFHKSAESDRSRVARGWENKVKEASRAINFHKKQKIDLRKIRVFGGKK